MELLSGLIGAVIGGIIAGAASIYAVDCTIKNEKKLFELTLEEEKRKDLAKRRCHASLIEADLLQWIIFSSQAGSEVFRRIYGMPTAVEFNTYYRAYIEHLSPDFTNDELNFLLRIYGALNRLYSSVMKYEKSDQTSFSRLIAEVDTFNRLLYTEEFIETIRSNEPSKITIAVLLESINESHKELLNKLSKLKLQ